MKRRTLLKAGFAVLVACRLKPLHAWVVRPGEAPADRPDFHAFFQIAPDGRVTCFVGKVEMGQGNMTALAQIAADGLHVPVDAIEMVMGDTDRCPWDLGTFGSMSVAVLGPVLRRAAAEARAAWSTANREGSAPQWTAENVGASIPRRDAHTKVTGGAAYAGDVRLPGMLYARVVRPPAHGATITSVNTLGASSYPGARVVRDGDLVAVLHEHPDEASAAAAAVVVRATPSPSTLDNQSIYEHLITAAPPGKTIVGRGSVSVEPAFQKTYLNAYVAHAPMETHGAVATVAGDRVTVWASTQAPFLVQAQVAEALRVPADRVRIVTPFVGGGFGGKTMAQQAVEAARLARATGRPVQVCWTRAEEFFLDTFRPAASISIASSVDASGRVDSWEAHVYGAGEGGAPPFYNIPNQRVVVYGDWQKPTPGQHPFGVGAWRAPACSSNAFARERHIDGMAHALGADPLEFRLRNLTDLRMARVIQAGARRFGWSTSTARARGVGMACAIYSNTYVSTFAHVEADRTTGTVRVLRLTCAQDMGQVVNPNGAMAQIEGALTMGLGYALTEEVRFGAGRIEDQNFDTYYVPRFSTLPTIEAVLVDAPDLPASAGGEPAVICVGAAIGNAIFDAIGVDLRELPMTPARVRQAGVIRD